MNRNAEKTSEKQEDNGTIKLRNYGKFDLDFDNLTENRGTVNSLFWGSP